jgi:hypothetical protein
MEAASTSETSVNFYQTKRHCNSEDTNLQTRRRENLKSYTGIQFTNLERKIKETLLNTYKLFALA